MNVGQLLFIQLNIFYIIYIGHMEFYKKKKYKKLEIVNEVILLLLSYLFLLFHHIVNEPIHLYQLGTVLILLTSILLLINVAMIFNKVYSKLTKRCKKQYYVRKHRKAFKKAQQAIWEAHKLQEQANDNFIIQQQVKLFNDNAVLQNKTRMLNQSHTRNPSEMSLLNISASPQSQPEHTRMSHGGKLIVLKEVVDSRDSLLPFTKETRKRRDNVFNKQRADHTNHSQIQRDRQREHFDQIRERQKLPHDMSLDLIVEENVTDPREERKVKLKSSSSRDSLFDSSQEQESQSSSSVFESIPSINCTKRTKSHVHASGIQPKARDRQIEQGQKTEKERIAETNKLLYPPTSISSSVNRNQRTQSHVQVKIQPKVRAVQLIDHKTEKERIAETNKLLYPTSFVSISDNGNTYDSRKSMPDPTPKNAKVKREENKARDSDIEIHEIDEIHRLAEEILEQEEREEKERKDQVAREVQASEAEFRRLMTIPHFQVMFAGRAEAGRDKETEPRLM